MRPQVRPAWGAQPGAGGAKPAWGVQPQIPAVASRAVPAVAANALKRPGAVETATAGLAKKPTPGIPAAAAGGEKAALTVSTQSKKDEIGIQTLVGDYGEKGTNHGKKVYQKMQKIVGHEDIKVFLYYWDQRDGADFSGWWFGDQVGGSQVWARSVSHGPAPPRIGWKIPWDSPRAEPGMLFVDPAQAGAGASTAAPVAATPVLVAPVASPGGAVTPASLQARVRKATSQVEAAEAVCNEVMGTSKVLTPASGEKPLNDAHQALQKQQTALMEVQKSLTQDISEARKGGVSATSSVTELSKLSPRLRLLQTGLSAESTKVKGLLMKVQQGTAGAKKQAEVEAATKAAEEKDTKELQESLPATQEIVTSSEEGVEAVIMMASPLIADPPDDQSDILKKAMEEIEAAAVDAQNKITEARKQINIKLQAARRFAPETRKNALTEFSSMQQKLTEAQKKLNPYKSFKKEFHARVEARKSLAELAEKLAAAELEVEKATMMSSAAEQGQMSEDDISSVEKVMQPAKAGVENSLRTLEQKLRVADGAMKDELTGMKDKATAAKKRLDDVYAVLRRQRESLTTKEMLKLAAEKVDKAEESLAKCQEAEMPFLKGIEILPAEESAKAIGDSEAAAMTSDQVMNQARAFLRTKIAEAKKYVKELSTSVTEELTAHHTRLEAAAKKLASFKKETTERKMAALLAEVVDGVTAGEKKVEVLVKAAEIFSSDSLDSVSIEALKEAVEKTAAAEKEASASMLEVRKVFAAKQKEAKGPDAAAALGKLQGRINAAQQELAKTRKAAASGEKLIKGKEVLVEEDEKIKQAEADITKSEKKVKPGEEEAALGIEAAQPSDADIEEMGKALGTAQKTLKSSMRLVEANLAGAPPSLKAALQKLVERSKAALEKITELMAATKEQRERVMSEAYVREGKAKTEEVEVAMEKVNDAELPFLKGIEVLPLKEATDTIAESEAAATAVQAAVSVARTLIASKNLEIRQFGEAASKPAAEEFAQLTERINAAAAKLGQFRKDTESRKKTAQMQEAAEKVAATEVEVKKMAEAVEPFLKEGAEAEVSEEACEKLVAQLKESQAIMDDAKIFLAARQKDVRGNLAHMETLKQLNTRWTEAQAEMAKHRKVAGSHEQKYTAKKLLSTTNEMLEGMDVEVKKATEACAPLLEEGGERFLVVASVRTLAAALRDHMKEKELTLESLYREVSGGAGGIARGAFLEYLAKLPEAIGREELAFAEERREAMFKHIDADGDASISLDEFKSVFKQRFVCVKEISVTDVFEVSKSKTTAKIEPGEVLDTVHGPQADESNGMMRIECTVVSSGKTGFVTMQGNQGTKFIDLMSPFTDFCKEMDKTIDETVKSVSKVMAHFNAKTKELATAGREGPMAEARTEFAKLRAKVTGAQDALTKLKAAKEAGKKDYAKREQAEKNAHIEARERKAAEAVSGPAALKVEAMEAAAKRLEETARPLVAAEGAELETFLTPISVMEEADKLSEALATSLAEARACVAAQQAELPKTVKGPMLEAKKELQKMLAKADAATKQCAAIMDTIRGKCQLIVDARAAEVSAALRAQMRQREMTIDRFFLDLVTPGDERISEAAFCRHVEGLLGGAFRAEQILLLCRHVEAGGIGRRRFQAFLQQYFVVVKGIAITNEFEISKAKTIRKAEVEEVLEVLEGPRTDEKLGVTRVKGKSLSDGVEGWISVKGNQGTPFLQEVEKPYYTCQVDIPLERDFKSEGEEGLLRTLKVDEILELIEGPRKETFSPGLRVRGKATLDGAMGWFTARDKKGVVFAEADSKYYSCTSSVAMTDNMDIKDCKVIRKLAVGELFTVEEGPVEEKDAGITRVKGKSLKDEKVGWITIKGNAGTVYAEASSKHYCVLQDVALTKKFPSSSSGEEVRTLSKGEAMQVLEGPKEESFPPEVRVRGRAVSDALVGWITLKEDNVRPWTPYYVCKVAAPMHDMLTVEGAKVIRQVEPEEALELIEGPVEEAGVLRMKARAEKDGVVGWVTLKDAEGKRLFES